MSDEQPRQPSGSDRGGEWMSSKAGRASASHKPATKEKQALADKSEQHVAAMLHGTRTADNLPVDTMVRHGGKIFGVEVKTIMDNANAKITMHKDALERKLKWAHSNHASLHTVVVDIRHGEEKMFYQHGVGSFRLHTLTPVNNGDHLRQLMGVK